MEYQLFIIIWLECFLRDTFHSNHSWNSDDSGLYIEKSSVNQDSPTPWRGVVCALSNSHLARGLLPDSADFGTTQPPISHLYFLTLVIMISIAAHLLIEKPARRLILGGKKYHGARVGGVA